MYGNQKWMYLQEVAKPYALDILEELKKKTMRFTELKKICLSQKTLTIRLHELEECNAIERIIEKPRKQNHIKARELNTKEKELGEKRVKK